MLDHDRATRMNFTGACSERHADAIEQKGEREVVNRPAPSPTLSHLGAIVDVVRTSSEVADYEIRLRRKLDRTSVQRNLALAGVVLTVHECLKSVIVDQLRAFLIFPGEADTRYQRDVLGLGGSVFEASCRWLARGGVLTANDSQLLSQFQQHRHAVAHGLLTFVADPDSDIDRDLLLAATDLLRRIGLFWARIDIDSDEEFDGRDIADEEITPGLSAFVDLLLSALVDS